MESKKYTCIEKISQYKKGCTYWFYHDIVNDSFINAKTTSFRFGEIAFFQFFKPKFTYGK